MKKYELGVYEKALPGFLDWEQKFKAAKELGYDYIEISIDETDDKLSRLDWTHEERMAFLALSGKYNVPVRSMCLSGHRKYPMGSPDPETEKRSMEIMEKAVKFSADLGIRIIQLAGYDIYYGEGNEDTDARFRRNLKKAVDMAAAAGVMLGFETMETEYMNTVKKALSFVEEVDSPYLGIYPDSGNITNAAVTYHTDVLEDLNSGNGHLVALHLKETVPGVFREVPYGTGHVDFDSMVKTAWKLGIRRYVTELWYTGEENWMEIVSHANRLMAGYLDEQE